MSNENTTAPTPKRRGRKPRSVVPVTLTIRIRGDAKMKDRIENMIDDLPQVGNMIAESNTADGFTLVVRYENRPEGRLARKAIIDNLLKLMDEGHLSGWTVAINGVEA